MKVAFWGTPGLAMEYLTAIADSYDVVGVVTQPDRPRGRGRKLSAPPVKKAALELKVPVLQPGNLQDVAFQQQLESWRADVFVIVSYGQILPASIIEMPPKGSVNVHYSLLPQLRGAAPVARALMRGLTKTGVTVQYVAEELDAGDIILQQSLAIELDDNTETLTERLTAEGIPLLAKALDQIATGEVVGEPQDDSAATYAPPLTKEEGAIDWCRPAAEIVNQVRGCFPWPGASCLLEKRRIKITRATIIEARQYEEGISGTIVEIVPKKGFVVQAKPGGVLVTELQPAGRRIMTASDFFRGARLDVGVRLEPISS